MTFDGGDIIIKIDGEEEITSIEGGETASKVYNLKLDNEHVYYANGCLVHNKENEPPDRGPFDDWGDNAPFPGGQGQDQVETCLHMIIIIMHLEINKSYVKKRI